MASIADLLGVQWSSDQGNGEYRLNPHAARQAKEKGFHPDHVLDAANNPGHAYPNGRYEGQMRHVKHGLVAVVDPSRKQVVTVYKDQEKTAPRADQTDRDAQRYARSYRPAVGTSR
jgi:hypothetical protein